MTEVHPNVHVCGEKEARELLLHHLPRNDDSTKKIPPLFSRVVAIGFPSAPLTEEEMTLLVRRSRFRFSRKSSLRFRARISILSRDVVPLSSKALTSSSSSSPSFIESRRTRKSTSFPFLSKTRSTPICSRCSARRRVFFLLRRRL